ncbi:cupin domain-containing protein [Streptomyces sp. NBC_01198]|uniref:cupin domain-containing protein n=1 Tax=Streptomyces sp. NBC_01198 TaxID=2903769 RepID=UPI002E0E2967|nr:cupin domain-containing protein [Streptomyces sp. NBC_01198]
MITAEHWIETLGLEEHVEGGYFRRYRGAVVGQDPGQGQVLSLAVPGGVWKASHLTDGDHGLISEAVAPGFDYADMTLAPADHLVRLFPDHAELVRRYCRPHLAEPAGPDA